MRNNFVHHFPGEQISLSRIAPEDRSNEIQLAAYVLEALDELKTCIQPLAADLQLGCCHREFLFFDPQVEPPLTNCYIQTKYLPVGVKIEPFLVNPQITKVDTLSKEIMISWIEKALQQKSPNPQTHQICWNSLYIYSVRARIFDENIFKKSQMLKLDSNLRTYELPLECRNNEYWIYNCQNLKTEFPFTLTCSHDCQSLHINISVHWSLWTQSGFPEYKALSQVISRIAAKGWKVNSFMEFSKA